MNNLGIKVRRVLLTRLLYFAIGLIVGILLMVSVKNSFADHPSTPQTVCFGTIAHGHLPDDWNNEMIIIESSPTQECKKLLDLWHKAESDYLGVRNWDGATKTIRAASALDNARCWDRRIPGPGAGYFMTTPPG